MLPFDIKSGSAPLQLAHKGRKIVVRQGDPAAEIILRLRGGGLLRKRTALRHGRKVRRRRNVVAQRDVHRRLRRGSLRHKTRQNGVGAVLETCGDDGDGNFAAEVLAHIRAEDQRCVGI